MKNGADAQPTGLNILSRSDLGLSGGSIVVERRGVVFICTHNEHDNGRSQRVGSIRTRTSTKYAATMYGSPGSGVRLAQLCKVLDAAADRRPTPKTGTFILNQLPRLTLT